MQEEELNEFVEGFIPQAVEDESSEEDTSSSDEEGLETTLPEAQEPATEVTARYSEPRPMSSVPLANTGKTPAEQLIADAEEKQRKQFEAYLNSPAMQEARAKEEAKAERDIEVATASEIAKRRAEVVHKDSLRSATEKAKETKQLEKLVDKSGYFDDEHRANCAIMNAYKEKYGKGPNMIRYTFKREYGPKMAPSAVKQEIHQVRVILNTQNLPTILKNFAIGLCGLLEQASIRMNNPMINLSKLKEDAETNFESGHFDTELDQIAIDWAEYFARGPEERFAWKYGYMIYQNLTGNLTGRRAASANIPAEVLQRQQNLGKGL